MAAPVNIQANLTLNPSSINASAKQVQQALGRITGQASEFQKSLDASTARVFAFGATTAVINGVTDSFKKLVSTTVNVQAKLIEINSILGAGAAEFNKYRNSIFQVAKTTGQTFDVVAEGAAELARQGLNATESAKRLEAALILTRISGLGAEASVKALTAAMNGFTSAGLSANQVVNKIVAVDTAFAVSAEDLAQGFSRAGSTAEDAGVKFEELLGLITAVEQRTARGGAVIGNAFKSIFTRLSRGDTIASLQELGVAIDANQSGVQKLQALSDALEKISDPTQASAIKELAGGVFQINVVSAALKDIGNDASIFGQATKTAFDATNEATEKNAALNESLKAQINELTVSVTSFAEKLGGITFAPLLENLVGIATSLSDSLDKALDPEKGSKFIQGLFKVIGSFISGPGLAIFTVGFFKIFSAVVKFAKEGFSTILQMGSATEKLKQIEGGIVDLLSKDAQLRQTVGSATATQAQKEQAVIQAIQRQNALLTQQQALVTSIASAARAAGVTGFSGGAFSGKGGKRFASGSVGGITEPDLQTAMMNEAKDAPRGAVPFVTMFRGKPAVMNSSEMKTRINGREEILTAEQIPRFAEKGKKRGRPAKEIYDPAYGMIVNERFSGVKQASAQADNGRKYKFDIYGIDPKNLKVKEQSELKDEITDNAVAMATREAKTMTGGTPTAEKIAEIKELNNSGAVGSIAGTIFDTALDSLTKSKDFDFKQNASFDYVGATAIGNIKKISPSLNASLAFLEAKIKRDSKHNKSMANKMARYRKDEGKLTEFGSKEVQQAYRAKNPSGNVAGALEALGGGQKFAKVTGKPMGRRAKGTRRFSKGSMRRRVSRFAQGSGLLGEDAVKVLKIQMAQLISEQERVNNEHVKGLEDVNAKATQAAAQAAPKPADNRKFFNLSRKGAAEDFNRAKDRVTGFVKGKGGLKGAVKSVGASGLDAAKTGLKNFGGFGLATVSAGLSAASEKFAKDGNSAMAELSSAGSSIAGFAGAGAQLAGPWGAAIGAVAGLGKSLYDATIGKTKNAEKVMKEAEKANPLAAITQISQGFFGDKGGLKGAKRGLKDLAKQTGDDSLDISPQLQAARDALANTAEGTDQFKAAQQNYEKVAARAARLLQNKGGLVELAERADQIRSKLASLVNNNEGKKMGQQLADRQQVNNARAGLLGVIQGKGPYGSYATDMMRTENEVTTQLTSTGQAKANLEDLKSQLAGAKDPEARAELKQQVDEAAAAFKQSVIDTASFYEQKQIETANKIAALNEERDKNTAQILVDRVSSITGAVRNGPIDLGLIDEFRKAFSEATTDEDRARMIADFEGGVLSKAETPEMAALLKKMAGIGTGSTNQLASDEDLARIQLNTQFEGGTKEQREALLKTTKAEKGVDRNKQIDSIVEELTKQADSLKTRMTQFGEAFNAQTIVNQVRNMSTALKNGADNFKAMQAASSEITGSAAAVNKLAKTAMEKISAQQAQIESLSVELKEIKGQQEDLTK